MKFLFTKSSYLILFFVSVLNCHAQIETIKNKPSIKEVSIKPLKSNNPIHLIKKEPIINLPKKFKKHTIPFSVLNEQEFLLISVLNNIKPQPKSKNSMTLKNHLTTNEANRTILPTPSPCTTQEYTDQNGRTCLYNSCTEKEMCMINVQTIGDTEPPRGCSTGHCQEEWNFISKIKWIIIPSSSPYTPVTIINQKGNVIGKSINEKYSIKEVSDYVAYPLRINKKIYGIATIQIKKNTGKLKNKSFYVRPK